MKSGRVGYFGSTINLLVSIQLGIAITAASLPDLRGMVSRLLGAMGFKGLTGRSGSGSGSEPSGPGELEFGFGGSRAVGVVQGEGEVGRPRRVFRPDWLRDTLPQSLMSTRIGRRESEVAGVEVERERENCGHAEMGEGVVEDLSMSRLEKIKTLDVVTEVESPGGSSNG